MTKEQIKEVLRLHKLWLDGESGGVRADLHGANLHGANLSRADLTGADLYGANLSDANLSDANLYDANLSRANLTGAKLPNFQICPQEGYFLAYKKTTKGVITLLIPEDAKRTNSLVGRKCRASKVVVIDGEGCGGTGTCYKGIVYDLGSVIVCDNYDDDIRVECTKGIHFFMTLAEAEEWR